MLVKRVKSWMCCEKGEEVKEDPKLKEMEKCALVLSDSNGSPSTKVIKKRPDMRPDFRNARPFEMQFWKVNTSTLALL